MTVPTHDPETVEALALALEEARAEGRDEALAETGGDELTVAVLADAVRRVTAKARERRPA